MESNNGSNPFEIITICLLGLAGTSGLICLRQKYKQGKISKQQIGNSFVKAVNTASVIARHMNSIIEECQTPSITNSTDKTTI